MKKYIKICISVLLVLLVSFLINFKAGAKTLAQLKKELSDAEAKYSSNQSSKAKTESEIKSIKNKISKLNNEKAQIELDMSNLNEELERLAEEIKKMDKDMKKIINYYQLSSSNSLYLEYAFSATSFTDFIYRLAVAEQLSEYMNVTIKKYNGLIEENKKKIEELAKKQVELDELENKLSKEMSNLGDELSSISDAAIEIKEEIKDLKSQINKYENTYKCSLNEELSVCLDRYYSSSTVPSAAGFYRPLKSGRITANYGYSAAYGSSYHYGIDIGVPHGSPVYAVADGRVAKITYKYKCGGNMVYIVHNVNGKKYTSAYFHLASVAVRENQVVSYDTVIGYSGGVKSIETWDKCSTGGHLHLQMATGQYMTDYFWYSNFQSKSFNPRNVIDFPSYGKSFSSR